MVCLGSNPLESKVSNYKCWNHFPKNFTYKPPQCIYIYIYISVDVVKEWNPLTALLRLVGWEFIAFVFCTFKLLKCMFSLQAQKAERDATDLKGSMRKRMEFLDFDWLILPWYEVMPCPQILVRLWPKYERCRLSLPDLHRLSGGGSKRTVATVMRT